MYPLCVLYLARRLQSHWYPLIWGRGHLLYEELVQTFLESPEHGVSKNVCTRSSYIDYGVGKPSGIGPMRSKHVYLELLIGRTSPRHRRVIVPPTFDHAPRTKRRGVSRACARCVPLPTAETASSTCVDAQIAIESETAARNYMTAERHGVGAGSVISVRDMSRSEFPSFSRCAESWRAGSTLRT